MKKLTEYESKNILKKYGIRVAKSYLAKDVEEAKKYANKIGYPVVMKVMSKDILHKTEAHGVETGIKKDEVEFYFKKIILNSLKFNKNAKIDGILIEESLEGVELIAGIKEDPTFGKTIMIGSGGILVEALKDISIRMIPIKTKDAESMIDEIKISKLFDGYRGKKLNKKSVVKTLLNISKLAEKEKIKEMDINPLFVNEKECIAGDIRIILD